MADLTVTAASVVKSTGATLTAASEVYGETVTAGQSVYRKSTDSKIYKAQSDGTAEEATAIGIALVGGAVGQPAVYQTGGLITIGATVAIGTIYVVSATAGGIAPWADLASTNYVTIVGIGSTAAVIAMSINASGIQHA
jgi:hypothetical protein